MERWVLRAPLDLRVRLARQVTRVPRALKVRLVPKVQPVSLTGWERDYGS